MGLGALFSLGTSPFLLISYLVSPLDMTCSSNFGWLLSVLLLRSWVESPALVGVSLVLCGLTTMSSYGGYVSDSCWISWILRDSRFLLILKTSKVLPSSDSTLPHSICFSPGLIHLELPGQSLQFSSLVFFILTCIWGVSSHTHLLEATVALLSCRFTELSSISLAMSPLVNSFANYFRSYSFTEVQNHDHWLEVLILKQL